MTKQVHKFSLEEILCPNEIKNKEDVKKEEPISEEVKDLLSKVSKTIGIVTFNEEIIMENNISKIKVPKIMRHPRIH